MKAKPIWTNDGRIHNAAIGDSYILRVLSEPEGYRVIVHGGAYTRYAKGLEQDLKTAKSKAVELAWQIHQEATGTFKELGFE